VREWFIEQETAIFTRRESTYEELFKDGRCQPMLLIEEALRAVTEAAAEPEKFREVS
jgi:hypothetical protein